MTLGAEAEAKYRLWPWPPFLFPADTELEAEIYLCGAGLEEGEWVPGAAADLPRVITARLTRRRRLTLCALL